MKRFINLSFLCLLLAFACTTGKDQCIRPGESPVPLYTEVQTGGVKMIPVMGGKYKVWTKKIGNGAIKVLLLHGGPGLTHEYFECMESYLPACGIEFYYYDQLGSHYSDHPTDTALWSIDRFTDEVEEVRKGLRLDSFYLLGHSWGGMLTMEYALKYPLHLKGVIISNMTASIPDYVAYINKLRDKLPPDEVAAMKKFEANDQSDKADYQRLVKKLYNLYICRLPEWPEPLSRSFSHINAQVYNTMQGNNEFVVTGKFRNWNVWDKVGSIRCPALVIGADYDEMDPKEMERLAGLLKKAKLLMCHGSHMCMWDDQQRYMEGLINWLHETEAGK